MAAAAPDNALEDELKTAGAVRVASLDEVGRGSYAGPLVVGAVISGDGTAPSGIRDSKLLRPAVRAALEGAIQQWAAAWAIGEVSATEIDEIGMAAALTMAARRALEALPVESDAVILDGPHDYVGAPWNVTARAKADLTCVSVAAASILAKEHRDRIMRELAPQHPQFALEKNMGYASPAHRAALAEHGPVDGLHRLSWKFVDDLPGFEHLRRYPGKSDDQQMTLL
jgi:ribonuclease HII